MSNKVRLTVEFDVSDEGLVSDGFLEMSKSANNGEFAKGLQEEGSEYYSNVTSEMNVVEGEIEKEEESE